MNRRQFIKTTTALAVGALLPEISCAKEKVKYNYKIGDLVLAPYHYVREGEDYYHKWLPEGTIAHLIPGPKKLGRIIKQGIYKYQCDPKPCYNIIYPNGWESSWFENNMIKVDPIHSYPSGVAQPKSIAWSYGDHYAFTFYHKGHNYTCREVAWLVNPPNTEDVKKLRNKWMKNGCKTPYQMWYEDFYLFDDFWM